VHELDAQADRLARRLETAKGDRVDLHQHHARRAARGGLEAERAAAGKEIEAGEPVKALPEPVEQRLAHAVRCRPQSRPFRHRDAPSAMLAANDPYAVFATGAARRRFARM